MGNQIKFESFYQSLYRSEFGFSNKLKRAAWHCVWLFLFRMSPKPCYAWRRWLLRLFGAQLTATSYVYPSVRIWAPWNLEMHERTALGDHVDCYSVQRVVICSDAIVSQYAHLCTASHDIESSCRALVSAPIEIKNGALVFSGAFVGMGVTVHQGAVVAARSVVVKDVAAFSVVGGNPAKLLKQRQASWVVREADI